MPFYDMGKFSTYHPPSLVEGSLSSVPPQGSVSLGIGGVSPCPLEGLSRLYSGLDAPFEKFVRLLTTAEE